jgi:hypothetical protein
MGIFDYENELLSTLDKYDQLVRDVVSGRLSFSRFLTEYDNFYMYYALDGHESDPEEQALLSFHEGRIAVHREIWENVLSGLAADEDAAKEEYRKARRFGSQEAIDRLSSIAKKLD